MKITDAMIKKLCSQMIYKRGVECFNEGRVHIRKRSDDEITSVVDGDGLYSVSIKFNNDKIISSFCTCAYYETMHTTCRHIVATLKQRRLELEEGDSSNDENDRLAAALCGEFARKEEISIVHAVFSLQIKKLRGGAVYSIGVEIPQLGGEIEDLEKFLDSYINYKDYKIDRNKIYNKNKYQFSEYDDKIISILAEVYETRSLEDSMYRKSGIEMRFGESVAKRIFEYLPYVDFRLMHEGMHIGSVRIVEDDPDIVIDVDAFEKDIIMSVSERGFALTKGGEWFFHNDTIYKTSAEWRRYFMPIYNALSGDSRTQITFKGENTMLFASHVLPELKNKHGVVTTGVDDLIVNTDPDFEVFLDADKGMITAVIVAKYGGIKLILPSDRTETNSSKLVLRNYEEENMILSYFEHFAREKSNFVLSDDRDIYDFISRSLSSISKVAQINMTDRFKAVAVHDDVNFSMGVGYRNDIDFLEINFETDMSAEEMRGILSAVRLKHLFFRREDGSFIRIKDNKNIELLRLLERLDLSNEDILSGRKILPKFHMLYLEANNSVKKDESIKQYMQKIRDIDPQILPELSDVLRSYQKDGIRWLAQLSEMGLGGILADDMGLGKTLQVIAYIHAVKPEKPVLIVAPSALVYNWRHEIEKFTPDATALIISGPKDVRKKLIEQIGGYEFILTSYPLLRRDIQSYKSIEFSYCFIDEAQYIKNPKTMNAVSVKRIKAPNKFALTGTPIENSLMELWSIFDFVMPGYLKTAKEFRERFETPGVRGVDYAAADTLRNIIRPFVLRRMKNDVLKELPEKIETTMFADLNDTQKIIYTEFLKTARDRAEGILSSGGANKMMILTLLLRLRQICCHPQLFDEEYEGESGKLELLMELVNSAIGAGHRILIFSQFRSMLDIIASTLDRSHFEYYYINGSTPPEERSDMAEKFNNGERDLFLVSLKAGGTGLNLIGADMVIHYDPWWNPAVTDQATDRAYRIGQKRAVQVIKLASRGSIEEKILKLQEKKRMLADDIIRVNTDALSNLTDEEIMSLFEL